MTLRRILIIAAILLGACLALLWNGQTQKTDLVEVNFNPEFALTGHDGRAMTERDFAEKYTIAYFGFTSCPDICPVELQKLADAYAALPAAKQKKLAMIFITIDPSRDTADKLKTYTAIFNPEIQGLTGTQKAIDAATKNYMVYAKKSDTDEDGYYTVNHTSMFYLTMPGPKSMGVLKTDLNAQQLAKNLNILIP